MITKVEHTIEMGKERMGVMESQGTEELQRLENDLGAGSKCTGEDTVGNTMRLYDCLSGQ